MAKNALQAQLLKAGLVDAKQAKKAQKQQQHQQKSGQNDQQHIKQAVEQAQQQKQQRDRSLDQSKQHDLEQRSLKANISQMIKQHQLQPIEGDIGYQFIDNIDNRIKKIYVNQKIYNALVAGSAQISRLHDQQIGNYAVLPRALADKIEQRMAGFVIQGHAQKQDQTTVEDDPYAAYVIPDDLMW